MLLSDLAFALSCVNLNENFVSWVCGVTANQVSILETVLATECVPTSMSNMVSIS